MAFNLVGPSEAFQMMFSPDGHRLALAMRDRSIGIWDAETGNPLWELEPRHQSSITRLAFSPDNLLLASGGGDTLALLWDMTTGRCLAELVGHQDAVNGLGFSPDNTRLVSGSVDGGVRIWDCRDGSKLLEIHDPSGGGTWNPPPMVWETLFTPDGTRIVASFSDKAVRMFDTRTGRMLAEWIGHSEAVLEMAISRDGSRLATASSDATVRVWETDTGTCLHELTHQTTVAPFQVAIAPDASRVTTLFGNAAHLWDLRTGKDVLQIPIPVPPRRRRSSMSLDGARLATHTDRDTVRLWTLFEVVLSQMPDVPDEWRSISDATGALVFADWLEERNRFDEANRLRLLTGGVGSER
jgi:uncharacterized protein (TIGR02996 family)